MASPAPVDPSASPIPTNPFPIPSSSNPSAMQSQDTLGITPELLFDILQIQPQVPIPSPEVPLGDWFILIVNRRKELKEALEESHVSDPLSRLKFSRQNIQITYNLQEQYSLIHGRDIANSTMNEEIRDAEEDFRDEPDKLNSKINAYNVQAANMQFRRNVINGKVQNVLNNVGNEDAYEDAAEAYNDEVDIYNEAVDNYNAAVDDYNEAVDKYNEEAEKLNEVIREKNEILRQKSLERQGKGDPPLPPQPEVPLAQKLPHIGKASKISTDPPPPSGFGFLNPSTPIITPVPPGPNTPENLAKEIIEDMQHIFLGVIAVFLSFNRLLERALEDQLALTLLRFQGGKLLVSTQEFYTRIQEAVGGTGTGGISGLVTGIDSSRIEAVLGQILVEESLRATFDLDGSPHIRDLSESIRTLLGAEILTALQLGIAPGGNIALGLNVGINQREFSNGASVSFATTNALVDLATSDGFREDVQNIVDREGVPPEVRVELTDRLTASGKISLLLTSAALQDEALGTNGLLLLPSLTTILQETPLEASDIGAIIDAVTKSDPEALEAIRQELLINTTATLTASGLTEDEANTVAEAFVRSFLAGQIPPWGIIPGLTAEQIEELTRSSVISVITAAIAKDAEVAANLAEEEKQIRDLFETRLKGILPEGSTLIDDALAAVGVPGSPSAVFLGLRRVLAKGLSGIPGGDAIVNELASSALILLEEENIRNSLKAGIGGGPEINLFATAYVKQQHLITDHLRNTIRDYNKDRDQDILREIPRFAYTFLDGVMNSSKKILENRLELGITYANALQEGSGSSSIAGLVKQTEKKEVDFRA